MRHVLGPIGRTHPEGAPVRRARSRDRCTREHREASRTWSGRLFLVGLSSPSHVAWRSSYCRCPRSSSASRRESCSPARKRRCGRRAARHLKTSAIAHALILVVGHPRRLLPGYPALPRPLPRADPDGAAARPATRGRRPRPAGDLRAARASGRHARRSRAVSVWRSRRPPSCSRSSSSRHPSTCVRAIAAFEAVDPSSLDASRTLGREPVRHVPAGRAAARARRARSGLDARVRAGPRRVRRHDHVRRILQGRTQTMPLMIYAQLDATSTSRSRSARCSCSSALVILLVSKLPRTWTGSRSTSPTRFARSASSYARGRRRRRRAGRALGRRKDDDPARRRRHCCGPSAAVWCSAARSGWTQSAASTSRPRSVRSVTCSRTTRCSRT